MPLSIYLAFSLVGAVAVACFAIFKWGRKQAAVDIASEKVTQAQEALKRAREEAKVMSESPRSKSDVVKWMREHSGK